MITEQDNDSTEPEVETAIQPLWDRCCFILFFLIFKITRVYLLCDTNRGGERERERAGEGQREGERDPK